MDVALQVLLQQLILRRHGRLGLWQQLILRRHGRLGLWRQLMARALRLANALLLVVAVQARVRMQQLLV